MRPDHRHAITAVMRANGSLATPKQSVEVGVPHHTLNRAASRGEVDHPRYRVYVPAGLALDWRAELQADLAACLAEAWAARVAALTLHGLKVRRLPPGRRELVVVGSARPTVQSEVLVHRTTRLDVVDQAIVDGLPCTSVARTVVDLCPHLFPPERLMLLDDAIMGEHVIREVMHDRATALSRGRKGVSSIIELTGPDGERLFKSRLERDGAQLLADAGLRDLQFNVSPHDAPDAGLTDVVCEAAKLIIDWDGLRFHAGRYARQRDNDKANAAALGGYLALRFTWYDQRHRPGYVMDTAGRAYRSRR